MATNINAITKARQYIIVIAPQAANMEVTAGGMVISPIQRATIVMVRIVLSSKISKMMQSVA